MAHAKRQGFWNQTLGVLLFICGTLLFLALLSYDARDVPSWLFYSSVTPSNAVPVNLLGIVGAVIAGFLYFLFGAASYCLPVALGALGVALFRVRRLNLSERLLWMLPLLISGAAICQLQPWLIWDWRDKYNLAGPGGWCGEWIGVRAFAGAFNTSGAMIIMGMIYVASVILVMGFHPIRFIGRVAKAISFHWTTWLENRRLRREEMERLREEQEKLAAKAAEPKPKPGRRKKAIVEEIESSEMEASPPRDDLPEPKIIDASVPAPPTKPSLAEINARRGKKSGSAAAGLGELDIENYTLPSVDLLEAHDQERTPANPAELKKIQNTIIDTLAEFSIKVNPGDITKGPTITRYEVYPETGVRVDRISSLEKDIARATRAERINILAPIPGKDTVGIEIANLKKVKVTLREILESEAWQNTKALLPIALGKDVYGKTIIADLAQMPHCLVAGTTGSGKSVCVNAIVASLLCRFSPRDLRFIMIDPKVVEMQVYSTLPHLVSPVVTEPKKVLLALRWVVDEMERRYRMFAKCGVRNIATFNARPKPKSQAELDAEAAERRKDEPPPEEVPIEAPPDEVVLDDEEDIVPKMSVPRDEEEPIPDSMPYIVVIVDELADLMQTAPADVETAIARITQKARAAGIHMIVATQTPRADVVTGIIKANIPSRVAFQVASKIDSRVILDENGAERLLGQGDMLYLPPGTSRLIRAQGVLVTDAEIVRLVEFVSAQSEPKFEESIQEKLSSNSLEEDVTDEEEELIEKCLDIIKQEGRASTSMLQRRLRLGYSRAARVVDILENRGILGPKDGVKDREILVDLSTW